MAPVTSPGWMPLPGQGHYLHGRETMEDPREYDLKRCPDCLWAPDGVAADCETCGDTRHVDYRH